MRAETASRPDGTTYTRSYPGTTEQVREVRADLAAVVKGYPFADDFILLASSFSTNAVMHSRSGDQGGVFTVRAEVRPGDYAWLEVQDQGGPWIERDPGEERGRARPPSWPAWPATATGRSGTAASPGPAWYGHGSAGRPSRGPAATGLITNRISICLEEPLRERLMT